MYIAVTGGVANPGFPGTGRQPLSLGQRPIVFAENCVKIKDIGPGRPHEFLFKRLSGVSGLINNIGGSKGAPGTSDPPGV